jgi:hypothetical protein
MAVFSEFIKEIVEVFMDYFSVYGKTFVDCLANLDKVLPRCAEVDLVLNWEKCHFMVKQGIVLGHVISERGIEVHKAKVETVEQLPPPTDVTSLRSFLGLSKLGIEHRVSTVYHPQTNRQVEILNWQLRSILNTTIEKGCKDWSKKLDRAFWAYRTAFKTPIGMTPYQFVNDKACHLPVGIEHKAYWAIKEMNLDLDDAVVKRRIQISELEEMRLKAYKNASIYKERIIRWYDKRLKKKEFKEGDKVLLYNSRFKTFGKGKLQSKWD